MLSTDSPGRGNRRIDAAERAGTYTTLVPFDTAPDALRAQTEALRSLGGERRLLTACRMSQAVCELALARIRLR